MEISGLAESKEEGHQNLENNWTVFPARYLLWNKTIGVCNISSSYCNIYGRIPQPTLFIFMDIQCSA